MNRQAAKTIQSIAIHTALVLMAAVTIIPIYWVVKSALTPLADMFVYPPDLFPPNITLANFPKLLNEVKFFRNMFNSLVVATAFTLVTVFLSSMVGFGFAKYRKAPGANILFAVVLASIMVPFQTLAISLFVHIAQLGWVNTYASLVVPLAANGFSAFMMTQFMQNFPDEVLEAARMDGCNDIYAYFVVVLPIMRPALGALAVLQFVHSWNDFFWPLLVLSKTEMYTVPLVLGSFVVQQAVVPYDLIAAGITLATIPMVIFFFFAQRQFIAGLTMGAFK